MSKLLGYCQCYKDFGNIKCGDFFKIVSLEIDGSLDDGDRNPKITIKLLKPENNIYNINLKDNYDEIIEYNYYKWTFINHFKFVLFEPLSKDDYRQFSSAFSECNFLYDDGKLFLFFSGISNTRAYIYNCSDIHNPYLRWDKDINDMMSKNTIFYNVPFMDDIRDLEKLYM